MASTSEGRSPLDCMRRIAICIGLMMFCIASASCGSGASGEEISTGEAPAQVTDDSRMSDPKSGFSLVSDFERIIFVKPGVTITTIGKNNGIQVRAFVSATTFYQPPLTVEEVVNYAGGVDQPSQFLAVMRCRPPDPAKVAPILATWPNVFNALTTDLGSKFTPADCPADISELPPDNQVYCIALRFVDKPSMFPSMSLAAALTAGASMFAVNYPPPKGEESGGDVLFDLYGVGSGFSGMGFAIKGSANVSLNSAQALAQSVVPEYLLNNVTLTDGGCNCIEVPPYPGRDQTPLSMDFVSTAGALGACTMTSALPG
jgi:hypothetical protein